MSFAGTERFELRRPLGKGGMGVVYEAFDSHLNTTVALKTLSGSSGDALLRFKTEFRALQDLQHPNLVTLGELMEHDGTWFFTMELVRGIDFVSYVCRSERHVASYGDSVATLPGLRDHTWTAVAAHKPAQHTFDHDRLRACLAQLAWGLAALHDANKVHRDVKPSNILVDHKGRVVVLDFGLITDRDHDNFAESGTVVGTVPYMSPEQAAGLPAKPSSDLYAVGVMLYEVLSGRLPFTGTVTEILYDKQAVVPLPPSGIASDIPTDLEELCVALLRIDPAERPTMEELLRVLTATGSRPRPIISSQNSPGPQFIGRTRELAVLDDAYSLVRGGGAAAVLVHGESGVGKSALIGEFVRRARQAPDAEVLLLSGRCYERESVPFKGIDGVIDSLAHHLAGLPEANARELVPANALVLALAFPVLSRVNCFDEAAQASMMGPQTARGHVFGALRELLSRLAQHRSIVITIDDLQWADADTFLLLSALFAAPAPPILLVASARHRISLLPDSNKCKREIELGTLPPRVATILARALLERAGVSTLAKAESIAKDTKGHPFYIAELARHASSGDEPLAAMRLQDAILLRASRLADDAQRVLELVSVAAGPLPVSAARQAVGLDASNFARHIATLRVSNLVRCLGSAEQQTVEPYHDRVRDSMLTQITENSAHSHHRLLAMALIDIDGDRQHPELLLHHLEASRQTKHAAILASDTARRAVESFAFSRAEQLLRTAIRLGDHDADSLRDHHRRLANALQFAGKNAEAADHYLLAAEGADPVASLENHGFATRALVITGHLDRGVDTMRKILTQFGFALPKSTRAAAISILWHRTKLALRGRNWTSRDASTIAKETLVRLDALQAVSDALGPLSPVLAMELGQRHLLMALRVGEPVRAKRALGLEAALLATRGSAQVEQARQLIADTDRYADAHGFSQNFSIALAIHPLLSFLDAEFEKAASQLEDAERTCREAAVYDPIETQNIRLFWIGALRELGAFARWRKLLPELLSDAEQRNDLLVGTSLRRVSVFLRLADGDPDAARADLEHASWPTPPGEFHLQHWYELQARAELALYERTTAEAAASIFDELERLRKSLLYYARPLRYPVNHLWARLWLAVANQPNRRKEALRRASHLAKRLRRDRAPHVDVWAVLIDAGVAATKGRDDKAVELLERAERDADALDLGFQGAAARWRRAGLIGGDAAETLRAQATAWQRSEGVSDMERIAELVAPGFDRGR